MLTYNFSNIASIFEAKITKLEKKKKKKKEANIVHWMMFQIKFTLFTGLQPI